MAGKGFLGYASGTTTTTAAGLSGVPTAPRPGYAVITYEDQPVRVRSDGTAPTATEGKEVAAGGQVELFTRAEIARYQHIRSDASTGNGSWQAEFYVEHVP
jgi:hypothetical protein